MPERGNADQRFLLLYGSQKGLAQSLSQDIQEQAEQRGLYAERHCLSRTSRAFELAHERAPVVIVVSTTGDGEPPDTATKFVRSIQRKGLPPNHFCHLRYTLLALGDSNYTDFCNCGRTIDQHLAKLGGHRFYPTGHCDDAVGVEEIAEPWIEGLWEVLKKELGGRQWTQANENTMTTGRDPVVRSEGCIGMVKESEFTVTNTDAVSNMSSTCHIKGGGKTAPVLMEADKTLEAFIERSVRPDKAAVGTCEALEPSPSQKPKDAASFSQGEEHGSMSSGDDKLITVLSMSCRNLSITSSSETKSHSSPANSQPPSAWTRPAPHLSNVALNVPSLPASFLEIDIQRNTHFDDFRVESMVDLLPKASSSIHWIPVVSAKRLTQLDAIKTTMELWLDVSKTSLNLSPGDSVGLICPNNSEEVSYLLQRLELEAVADCLLTVHLTNANTRKGVQIPVHILSQCSLRMLFTHILEIRAVPKKAFLRSLAEHAEDPTERHRLLELCSRQGAADYLQHIRKSLVCLADLLHSFPTLCPPVALLLEHLPCLQARSYSISSSPLQHHGHVRILFNIVEFPTSVYRASPRRGVCTGWLTELVGLYVRGDVTLTSSMDDATAVASKVPQVPLYARPSTSFHLPEDRSRPVIMVGPGTGLAPFLGFLQHRKWQQDEEAEPAGEMWLFYGCRHCKQDYLYRDELEAHMASGVLTRLLVAFSRDNVHPSGAAAGRPTRYVQDNLRIYSKDVVRMLLQQRGYFYICGEARNMAPSVHETLVEIVVQEQSGTKLEAMRTLATMKKEGRYLQDIWT
uniref:methionine synthase reductase n=1 Tax=Myxine glutinosa TaxID=7769 RepID=UPI00358E8977